MLSTEETAALTGVAVRTLEDWRTQTPPVGPPFVRLGKKVSYPRQALIDWIAENVTVPESSPALPRARAANLLRGTQPPPPADDLPPSSTEWNWPPLQEQTA